MWRGTAEKKNFRRYRCAPTFAPDQCPPPTHTHTFKFVPTPLLIGAAFQYPHLGRPRRRPRIRQRMSTRRLERILCCRQPLAKVEHLDRPLTRKNSSRPTNTPSDLAIDTFHNITVSLCSSCGPGAVVTTIRTKKCHLYIAHSAAATALCVTDRAGVQHRPLLNPALTDSGLRFMSNSIQP